MAQAKVYPPVFNVFAPPRTVPGGWAEEFGVFYQGADVPEGGTAIDTILVEFQNGDSAQTMDNRIRDAVRAKATARGFSVGITDVISFAPPRRL
jgi:hypothetical protein